MLNPGAATVIVVDDDHCMREALDVLITSAGYRCQCFASAEAFLAAPGPPTPCCLLLDMQLEGINGLELQNVLSARRLAMPVLFLSGDSSIARAVSAMKAGALDFLQKPYDPELLLGRIERAMQTSAEGYSRRKSARHDAASLADLTDREDEILALLVQGNANREVAQLLEISSRTAETHRKHVMDKLEGRTLADLVNVWLNTERAAP